MRSVLVVMLLVVCASTQESGPVEASCGPKGTSFDIKLDKSQHPLATPEPGKARVYFVQDTGGELECFTGASCLTTRIGIDGAWVGANHHNSYFSASVEPGEHHICANWQSHVSDLNRVVAFAHFSAEEGKIYFFRTRPFGTQGNFEVQLDIDPLDSDQAKHLITHYPLSESHSKR